MKINKNTLLLQNRSKQKPEDSSLFVVDIGCRGIQYCSCLSFPKFIHLYIVCEIFADPSILKWNYRNILRLSFANACLHAFMKITFIFPTGSLFNNTISLHTKQEHLRSSRKRKRQELNDSEYSQMEIMDQRKRKLTSDSIPHTPSLPEEKQ